MWFKCLFVTLVSFSLIGIGFAVNARRRAESHPLTIPTAVVETGSEVQTSTVGPIRTVRFTLFEAGIRPAEMRLKPGLVNLMIEDKTNTAAEVTLQKMVGNDREALGRIVKTEDLRGRNTFRLAPGKYQVTDVNRPNITAVLLVEP
jgi:hypothetical protein